MPVTVIGYYTKDTPYEQDMKVLRLSLDAYSIPHNLIGIDDRGGWQENTTYKPYFVRDMLDVATGPVVYIDVDAFVLGPLTLLEQLSCSIAACVFGSEMLSGTLYLRPDDTTRRIVDRWIELTELYPETLPDGRPAWDQRTLKMAVAECTVPDAFVRLPHEYAYIVGLTPLQYQLENAPVIVHTRGRFRHHPKV